MKPLIVGDEKVGELTPPVCTHPTTIFKPDDGDGYGGVLIEAMDRVNGKCDWCGPDCDCVCNADGKCGFCDCYF